ncbi:MAG: hypothetical protein ACJA2S_004411 [Cyclobacteriaceae bacterium]|jgi:hypothetical protein
MNYKDKTFEIDDNQIRFKNTSVIIYLSSFIATGLIIGFLNKSILPMMLGTALGIFLTFGVFVRLYWKNTIDISEISQVKVSVWNSSIDKDTNFWGIGNYRYHFPTGLNKKTNPRVIFVHRKEKKLAVGFIPENCDNVISVLRERGVEIIG